MPDLNLRTLINNGIVRTAPSQYLIVFKKPNKKRKLSILRKSITGKKRNVNNNK